MLMRYVADDILDCNWPQGVNVVGNVLLCLSFQSINVKARQESSGLKMPAGCHAQISLIGCSDLSGEQ